MSVILAGGTWYYLHRQKTSRESNTSNTVKNKESKRKISAESIWEIEDIKKGVVILSNNRYRLICRMSAADFWILSEEEQDHIEDAAASMLRQLSFPVQILMTSQAVDTSAIADELRVKAKELPEKLQYLAYQRADYLDALMSEKSASAKQAYIVIPFDTIKGFDTAYGELMARLSNIADGLAEAKVKVEPLSTEAVIDLLGHLLNRERSWRPSEGIKLGVLSEFHVS